MKEMLTFDDVQIVPKYSELLSRNDCNTMTQFTRNFKIGVPLVGAPMDTVCGRNMVWTLRYLGAVGCLHRFMSVENQLQEMQAIGCSKDGVLVATIGATGDYQQRARWSVVGGANILLIDVAHGDHIHVKNAMDWLNKQDFRSKVDVIAGNIATAESAIRLEDWGADALRVGIGGGSMCETRIRTGIGVPQLGALMDVLSVSTVPVISDGGVRYPGDVAKALAAGADSVMIGSLFAGTDESPGEIIRVGSHDNIRFKKVFRGSASAAAKADVNGDVKYVEGASTLIDVKGSVKNIVSDIMDGVRSAMSYVGATNLTEFRANAEFIKITNSGLMEAHPHGIR